LFEGKKVPASLLLHEAKKTQPCEISKINKAVSILSSEAKTLRRLVCH